MMNNKKDIGLWNTSQGVSGLKTKNLPTSVTNHTMTQRCQKF